MDGQDEENRRIYNQGDSTKRGDDNSEDAMKFYRWSIRRGEEKIILGRGPMTSFDLPPNRAIDDPVPQRSRPTVEGVLTKAQFSSRFSTKFIVLGLLGLSLLTSTVNRAPQIGTLQLAPSVGKTWGLVKAIIEQGRAKPPRGNDDGQPTGP